MRNIFKPKKYLDCKHMKHSIHFFYDDIRCCCSNVKGCIFKQIDSNYEYSSDLVYDFYFYRKNIINKINNFFTDENFPFSCQGCTQYSSFLSKNKVKKFDNYINKVYIHNFMGCNAKCIYCAFGYYRNNKQLYYVLPIMNELIDKNILSKNAHICFSGGEPTISDEFEILFSKMSDYVETQMEVLTSCIKYSESIANAFKQNRVKLLISLDSGSPEVYKKVKQVDAFDKVIENLKTYIDYSENAKSSITLKYIILDGVNDDLNEIYNFLDLTSSLGIESVMFSFDCVKYRFDLNKPIPNHYLDFYTKFVEYSEKLGLLVSVNPQAEPIMRKYFGDEIFD